MLIAPPFVEKKRKRRPLVRAAVWVGAVGTVIGLGYLLLMPMM